MFFGLAKVTKPTPELWDSTTQHQRHSLEVATWDNSESSQECLSGQSCSKSIAQNHPGTHNTFQNNIQGHVGISHIQAKIKMSENRIDSKEH